MIYAGTCSWAEKTLLKKGLFYPSGCKNGGDRLRYYSSIFNCVEADSIYYSIPKPETTSEWAEAVGDDFVFSVKVYGALTGHPIDVRTLPADIRNEFPGETENRIKIDDIEILKQISATLRDGLYPLSKAGKLGPLLFQFPPTFEFSRENLATVLKRIDLLKGFEIAVEFRHGSWFIHPNLGFALETLKDAGAHYVTADSPQFKDRASVPFFPEVTCQTAYFRFHGRNRVNWRAKVKEVSLRYDYRYSEKEIEDFAASIEKVIEKSKRVFVMFNNCRGKYAVENTIRMMEILNERSGGKIFEKKNIPGKELLLPF